MSPTPDERPVLLCRVNVPEHMQEDVDGWMPKHFDDSLWHPAVTSAASYAVLHDWERLPSAFNHDCTRFIPYVATDLPGLVAWVDAPELRGAIELPGGLMYPSYRLMLIVFGVFVGLSLWLLYRKTQIGAVVRAGVDDREIVSAVGINIDRLFVLISALASLLAGMAGVVGGAFLTLYPGAEWEILIYALVVVIFGGLGSLEGAMIGALIVGLLDAYGRWLLPELSYFVLFGPMALLLLVRPRGIFGREG